MRKGYRLPEHRRKWSRAGVLGALQQLSRDLGIYPLAPSSEHVAKADRRKCPSLMMILVYFATLREAQAAADLTLRPRRGQWTTCKHGHPMTKDSDVYFFTHANGVRFRRCRICHRDVNRRRRQVAPKPARSPRLRWFVKPEVALRHSPAEMARYWGLEARSA